MKFKIVGGGPSGLYLALLAKARFPDAVVDVYEQNPRGATYGFGIVLAESGLDRMRNADAESYEAIMKNCYMTSNRLVVHPKETIFVEGGGYGGAIARLRLLSILEKICESRGVTLHHNARTDGNDIDDADLIVGADGVGSALRKASESGFGTSSWQLTNRMAWYGTTRHFPYPILSFRECRGGHFVAAAYPYTESMSTFVAECDANTWFTLGMDKMSEDERKALAEEVFEPELAGVPLIGPNSRWVRLPVVRNKQWSVGKRVLIGDALHSAHPTIGSGTRIAMEDSIALIDALVACPDDIPAALVRFRQAREPAKDKLVVAAEKSFAWYEGFSAKMQSLEPVDFVFDFMTRTGRVDEARLRAGYPEFMNRYAHRWSEGQKKNDAAAKRKLAGVTA